MADIFVDSAAAGAGTGADWANAYTNLSAALAVATSADTIYVANTHSHSQTTAKTLALPSASWGLRILCVTPSGASGNSGLATGAVEACGAASVAIAVTGYGYIYGLTIQGATNNSSSAQMQISTTATPGGLFFESCTFDARTINASGGPLLGASGVSSMDDFASNFVNCTFKFGATTQSIGIRSGAFNFQGMSIDAAGSAPTSLFAMGNGGNGFVKLEASDLSGKSWTNLLAAGASTCIIEARNCKFPSGISALSGTPAGPGAAIATVHNCDSGDTQYNYIEQSYAGTVVDETTIVRSGGGATSVRMDSNANTKFPYYPLTVEGSKYNSSTGSALTLTIEYVADENVAAGQGGGTSNAFTDAELYVEVQHQGTSGFPKGVVDIDDRAANALSTPADQTSSSVTWTTTGLTTPKKGKMTCTFTPQEAGYVHFKVCLAKASKTVYVDLLGASIA